MRSLFNELANGIVAGAAELLKSFNSASRDEDALLLHALSVVLAVVELATARPKGERVAASILMRALTVLSNGERQ